VTLLVDLRQGIISFCRSQMGLLKKAASGVLAIFPCSRTKVYAPRVKTAAALLDGLF
jgi:hypothetical protein